MNKAFKVIWSEARNAYVVVSEMAKSHGTKSCSTKKLLAMLIATGIMTCASVAPVMAEHLASGDTEIVAGNGASASGQDSVAIGKNAQASKLDAIAIGGNAVSSGGDSLAIGGDTKATQLYSIAIGNDINFTAYGGTAVGQQAYASGKNATAIGYYTNVDSKWNAAHGEWRNAGEKSTAIGVSAGSWGDRSTAVGSSSKAEGSYATAVGSLSQAKGYLATAIGCYSQATADRSTALGYNSQANVEYGTALGFSSKVTAFQGVAIGDFSVADRESGVVGAFAPEGEDSLTRTWKANAGAVSVGINGTLTRQITNVAAGSEDTDAVNVAQLHQAKADINNRINQLGNRVNKVGAGAAALAALHPMDFDPDDKLTFSAGYGNYGGENAVAIGAYYRPDEKVMFSVGGTVGNGENMVNAGISFALDRTNHVSNSRTAMAREILDLRAEVAELKAMVAKGGLGSIAEDKMKIFPDVAENHWAYEYIGKMAAAGIIEGYPDGNFGGDRMMSRYEFAAMLYRAMQQGVQLDSKIINEFAPEMGRIRVDRISGEDGDRDKIERVRVNAVKGERDHYGNKIAKAEAKAK